NAAHHVVEEEVGGEPLALQASLHVGEGDDNRVDIAFAHLHAELLEGEHPAAAGVRGCTALLLHGPPVRGSVCLRATRSSLIQSAGPGGHPGPAVTSRAAPGTPRGQLASSCSIAASSSALPWTRGPVNQFRAEASQ